MSKSLCQQDMYPEAEIYLKKAYEKDSNSIFAALDLVRIWLRNPHAHVEDFSELFKKLLENPILQQSERAKVLLFRAIQKFIMHELKEAAEEFYEAICLDEEAVIVGLKVFLGIVRIILRSDVDSLKLFSLFDYAGSPWRDWTVSMAKSQRANNWVGKSF